MSCPWILPWNRRRSRGTGIAWCTFWWCYGKPDRGWDFCSTLSKVGGIYPAQRWFWRPYDSSIAESSPVGSGHSDCHSIGSVVAIDGEGRAVKTVLLLHLFKIPELLLKKVAKKRLTPMVWWGAYSLVRESIGIFLQTTPNDINVDEILDELHEIKGLKDIPPMHLWTITSGICAMSVHVLN